MTMDAVVQVLEDVLCRMRELSRSKVRHEGRPPQAPHLTPHTISSAFDEEIYKSHALDVPVIPVRPVMQATSDEVNNGNLENVNEAFGFLESFVKSNHRKVSTVARNVNLNSNYFETSRGDV